MLNKTEILDYLRAHKSHFYLNYNITKIGIFGSFARDEQTESSDIDLIIEMPRGTEDIFEKKQALKNLLRTQFDKEVDICRERSLKPLFKEIILKEAIYV